MATPPVRPLLRARWDRRRRELVDAAAARFARDGYDGTTVQDLTEALGLAAGGMYHYFPSKDDLLIAICDELMEPLLVQARALPAAPSDADPAVRLRELVRLWVAHLVEHRDHVLVFQQQRHLIERAEGWAGVRAARKEFELLLSDALAAAGVAERLPVFALLGMVNHTAWWYRPGGALTAQQIADGYVGLVLSGVGGAPRDRA
jgi:AcrR family transcriptional regulator